MDRKLVAWSGSRADQTSPDIDEMVLHFEPRTLRITRAQGCENPAMLLLRYAAAHRRHDALLQGSPIGFAAHGIDRVIDVDQEVITACRNDRLMKQAIPHLEFSALRASADKGCRLMSARSLDDN